MRTVRQIFSEVKLFLVDVTSEAIRYSSTLCQRWRNDEIATGRSPAMTLKARQRLVIVVHQFMRQT